MRKSLGKRLRFEIFKRDGFRCQYCGADPTKVVLHVDHVLPVIEGGTNDPINLLTACQDCNGGKAAIPLDRTTSNPRVDQEAIAERVEQIREYLEAQQQLVAEKQKVIDALADHWERQIGTLSREMYGRLPGVLEAWPFDKIVEAIGITGSRLGAPGEEYRWATALGQQKYFYGVLRRWREEA